MVLLLKGKKKLELFFQCVLSVLPSGLCHLIEEINNAVMGFCREISIFCLVLPNILFKIFQEVGKPPDLWCLSFPESFQNMRQKMEKKAQWASLFFR